MRPALDLYFPESTGVRIIAEPGRYFVDASMTIFASVIGRRALHEDKMLLEAEKEQKYEYPEEQLNSSDALLMDHSDISDHSSDEEDNRDDDNSRSVKKTRYSDVTKPITGYMIYINDGLYQSFNCIVYDHATVSPSPVVSVDEKTKLYQCSVWGPTCDGLDKVTDSVMLPELNVGDWVYFTNCGAYTFAAASSFNGISPPERCYIN